MFLPIGDTQVQGGVKPVITYGLIALNVLVYFWSVLNGVESYNQFLFDFGVIPSEITRGTDMFTLFTSMFLHGGLMHLIGNMVFLWIFADNVEAIVGNLLFFVFYIAGGLVGSAAHILTDVNSMIPSIGASGAISAVLGAYLVMFPKSKIKTFVLFFIMYIPALVFLLLWFGQQMISGIGEMSQLGEGGGVAWWAHIGGFVFGVAMGFIFKQRVNEHNYKRDTSIEGRDWV